MIITCLGHKRDMRGKHHIYGLLQYENIEGTKVYLQFWGECKSAHIHFRELTFWDLPAVPRRIEEKGYRPLLADRLERSFPKVIDTINQELLVRAIRGT